MKEAAEEKLERLLAEQLSEAVGRAGQAFDLAAAPWQSSLVLFGTGQQGRRALRVLRAQGIEPLAFADSNPELWNREVEGLIVLSPAEAARRYGDRATFVLTVWNPELNFGELEAQLRGQGCAKIVPLPYLVWKYADQMLPCLFFDAPKRILAEKIAIRDAFDLFGEPESREVFADQLELYLSGMPQCVDNVSLQEEYFPADLLSLREDEFLVDVGAFDGDVLQAYLERGAGRYLGLEPDPASFCRLRERVATFPASVQARVALQQVAASHEPGVLRFAATGTRSARISADGDIVVPAVPLDEVVGGLEPTFIKMDIEGHEYEALLGAQQVIRRQRPVLAISLYHCPVHLWRIPRLISRLVPEYALFLRRYARCGFELDLYALPPGRSPRVPTPAREVCL